ncbi:cytosine permease [Nonomuraea sp. NPDC050404]|uniref:cytosine permease n=1 Tax=Nonomuraea sp. NPDC050404 TaxID=3155783 RepID=UPI0033DAA796
MGTDTPAKRAEAATGAPGYRIALILLGIITTPVVLSSPTLGSGLPLPSVITSVVAGSLILMIVAVFTLAIGEHARQPTYDVVRFPFGRGGAKAITALLGVSVFGWATVTANGFGTAAQRLVTELTGAQVPLPVLVTFGCVLFVAATAFGFEILGKVAQFAVPVIALLLGYLVYVSLSSARDFVTPGSPMDWGVAVSSVVGTGTVLAVTSADFGSFARGRGQALTGGVLAFGIAYPLLYIAGAVPAALTGQSALIDAMAMIASALPAVALLVFAAITANAGNIFQGTLAVSSLVPRVKKWQASIALGAGAAVLGSLDVAAWLPNFLLFLGIAAPPVAGIIIADFLRYRRHGYDAGVLSDGAAVRLPTFVAWVGGCAVGYLTAYGTFSLTQIPSIDSLLSGGLLYALITGLTTRSRR